ncbi:hypothetical protein SLEP1_g26308 [Rubroshorea leprosula]|uniref:Photosystem II protein N n=1 Tax=Rubroshorea leprosula TaxID=152421 RepID=A0AAV5JPI2_9ROSI|nr:hypothetical protein SLEP1_g26308 [Rubroshorea leprosula]
MTYRGDVYFVSVLVLVFHDYTGWHAISLIKRYTYLLIELSHSFSLSTISRSEVKDGEKRGE